MSRVQIKSGINKRLLLKSSLVFGIFFIVLFIIQPNEVHAEAVYSVLRDTTSGTGLIIQNIWKDLLAAINSLVIIVLIVVAFAEMLRININTYGLKKILPTLLFAIIAANFSFLFCRVIIDVANVSMTFLSSISGQGLKPSEIKLPDFVWSADPWYKQVFPLTVLNLSLLVEAIILLCLAFLLLARNWVLYVLVIFSSVGIMALVLPQTKKYFNMWWENLIKWTFMPLVSYLFIALANRFSGSFMTSADTGTYVSTFGGIGQALMGAVFAGVCYYFAITMPFKLGGAIMDNFYKMTGAKHFVGKTKELAGMKLSNIGETAWYKYLRYGLDAQRGDNLLGKTGAVGRFIGRNWIGNALNKEKGRQKEIQADIAGVVEGVQARDLAEGGGLMGNGAEKMLMRRHYRKNRGGEIKEFEDYAFLDFVKKGMDDKAQGKANRNYDQLIKWRLGSGQAKHRMAMASEVEAGMISDGVTATINGRLRDKSSGRERIEGEIKEAEALEAMTAAEVSALSADEQRDRTRKISALSGLRTSLRQIKDKETADWMKVTGMSRNELRSFRGQMETVVVNKLVAEELQNKAQKDLLVKAAMKRVGIHNVVDTDETVNEAFAALRVRNNLLVSLQVDDNTHFETVRNALSRGVALDDHSLDQFREGYERYLAFSRQNSQLATVQARAEALLHEQGLLQSGQHIFQVEDEADVAQNLAAAQGNVGNTVLRNSSGQTYQAASTAHRNEYAAAVASEIQSNYGGVVPSFLQNQVSISSDGTVTLGKDERTSFTRLNGPVNDKTRGREEEYFRLTTTELLSILQNGDLKDGITREEAQAMVNGGVVAERNHYSRLKAAWGAAGRHINGQNIDVIVGVMRIFEAYKPEKNQGIYEAWISAQMQAGPIDRTNAQQLTALNQTIALMGATLGPNQTSIVGPINGHDVDRMITYYRVRTARELRRDMCTAILPFLP